MLGLGGLKFSFLREEETGLALCTLVAMRFEQISLVVFVTNPLLLSPLNLLLGDGDLKPLLDKIYGEFCLSGSLRKLFCRDRSVGELDRTLFCGVEPFILGGIDCFTVAAIDLMGESNFLA